MSLPCVNCRKDALDPKLFDGVYLCAECHQVALRSVENLERELHALVALAREAIRLALIEGRLQLQTAPSGETSKKDLLKAILSLPAAREDSDANQ